MGDGLDARRQAEHKGNKRIDIEVKTPQLTIAVECEKHGSNKSAEAVKDASSRLYPIPMVDVAVAVVYPKKCNTEDDLTPNTELSYCIVNKSGVAEYAGDHKSHSEDIDWMSCTASKFARVLKHLYRDTGEPDIIANKLKRRLAEAVRNLSTIQCRSLASAINVQYIKSTSDTKLYNAAKRALLVVAAAALFHARLAEHLHVMERPSDHDGDWPPPTLDECDTRQKILAAWNLILKHDYRPIFETGIAVLGKSTGQQFASAIESVITWARETADDVAVLRHDLLGQMFHAVLDTARHDGSMYTSIPAAKLLAGIAIRDRSDIPENLNEMKILDPACGTGTLLMAAAERVQEIMGDEYDPNGMVENVLCGVDINVTAAHMAATTIGMLSPDTKFDRMDVHIVDFGVVRGEARAGSLEMYASDGMLPYVEWTGAPDKQVDTGEAAQRTWKGMADLLIMNPPFTRNDLRHDQLGQEAERVVKEREDVIFKRAPKGIRYSSGPMFMLLAEHLLQKSNGCLAVVLPVVVASSQGNLQLRKFLASKYHIDTMVITHDTKRYYFSDSTSIVEMLIILRREEPRETKIINLAVNPKTVAGATTLADAINNDSPGDYQIVSWPRSKVEAGDWSGVLFYSPYLVDKFAEISSGKMFTKDLMGNVASLSGSRAVRGAFTASDNPDRYARFVRYDHKTAEIKCMCATPNKYLIAKQGKERQAEVVWETAGFLHVGERIRLNITHTTTIKTDNVSIGSAWHTITPKTGNREQWSKAMVVWLNSTVGLVSLLGARIISNDLSYVRFGIGDIENMNVPILDEGAMHSLAGEYDLYSRADLGLIRSPNKTRIAMDKAVCKALNLDESVLSTMRTELSREPMITGKQYGAQPDLLDRYE